MRYDTIRYLNLSPLAHTQTTKSNMLSIASHIVELFASYPCDPPTKTFYVKDRTNSTTSYTSDEFAQHFSISEDYTVLSVTIYSKQLSLSCSLGSCLPDCHIYGSSDMLTTPQLEDLLADVSKFLSELLSTQAVNETSSCGTPHINGPKEPLEAHEAKASPKTRKKFYQSTLFWGAVAALIPVVIWLIDRFVFRVQ